ncbi:response regulator [uncultured Desulfosarcina sp.]|uniref:response regulator n=1 Tax=uncultured Desulfosarcina sp. TaxID=218289 RepID=UPI0029C6B6C4|nr:response regulator [uncultured Desulfosarcina sp.]
MIVTETPIPPEFYSHFKLFHEMMAIKVKEILLVSSPYDAFIMEEDGSLASRIINEYSGLNLSHPPRVTQTASALEALSILGRKKFDLVITTPQLEEMDAFSLSKKIKHAHPTLPVILLSHTPRGVFSAA